VGVVGELHPNVLVAFELLSSALIFEINLAMLLPFTTGHKAFQPIPRFPPVVRDIALIAGSEVSHQQVETTIRSFSLVRRVNIFDVYRGEAIPKGKKSLAYRITFQSPDHTLTDEEADRVQQQILGKLSKELGAALRT